jgi:hypothetical protein
MRIFVIDLKRSKCEESYRFIKQAYNLEDVRRHFSHLDKDTQRRTSSVPLALDLCPEFLGKSKG